MNDIDYYLTILAALIWFCILLLPWSPWRIREVLEAQAQDSNESDLDLSDITVVIPARDEAQVIAATLSSLQQQDSSLRVILVDDHSSDGTAQIASCSDLSNLQIIQAAPLPAGWTGKLWALNQGVEQVTSELILLLDADIKLESGMLHSLLRKRRDAHLQFVSLMAKLRFVSFWERLLMPAFIFFFKMLYPFALSNSSASRVAAAAGGCILVETKVLKEIGGLAAIKDAVIDDCNLAKQVSAAGYKTWIGLTHGAISLRPYQGLTEIWEMVARTAYTQLRYSIVLLLLCSAILIIMYWIPLLQLVALQTSSLFPALLAIMIMLSIYAPLLKYYHFTPLWGLALPLIASLYLLMTWTSALRYWCGERTRWKGRVYQNN